MSLQRLLASQHDELKERGLVGQRWAQGHPRNQRITSAPPRSSALPPKPVPTTISGEGNLNRPSTSSFLPSVDPMTPAKIRYEMLQATRSPNEGVRCPVPPSSSVAPFAEESPRTTLSLRGGANQTTLQIVLEAARRVIDSYGALRIRMSPEESAAILDLNFSISKFLSGGNPTEIKIDEVSEGVGALFSTGGVTESAAFLPTSSSLVASPSKRGEDRSPEIQAAALKIALERPSVYDEISRLLKRFFDDWTFSLFESCDLGILRRLDVDHDDFSAARDDPGYQSVLETHSVYSDESRLLVPVHREATLVGLIEAHATSTEVTAASLYSNPAFQAVLPFVYQAFFIQRELKDQATRLNESDGIVSIAKELTREVADHKHLANSVVETVCKLCDADRCTLFVCDNENLVSHVKGLSQLIKVPFGTGIAGVSAATGQIQNVRDAYGHPNFHPEVDKQTGFRTRSILCVPIIDEGKIVAVAELLNKRPVRLSSGGLVDRQFTDRDVNLVRFASPMIALCLKISDSATELELQSRRLETMYHAIETGAQANMNDRGSFFSTIVEGAKQLNQDADIFLFSVDEEKREVRLQTATNDILVPHGSGIVGSAVADAWKSRKDPVMTEVDLKSSLTFVKEIDAPGTSTPTKLLYVPLVTDGKIVGMLHLVFSDNCHNLGERERLAMKDFGKIAAVWLRNFSLLDFTVRVGRAATKLSSTLSRNKTPHTAVGVVDVARRDEVLRIELPSSLGEAIATPTFNIFQVRSDVSQSPLTRCTRIILDLFRQSGLLEQVKCSERTMAAFLVAVRERYRSVPYHNFYHAVDVVQTLYTFLYHGNAAQFLQPLECFVLLVAGSVHDIDHMGLNNSFHLKADTPLGILSSVSGNNSVLEVHHCNLAIELLGSTQLNVFEGLTSADETTAYRLMVECILATDMSRHKELQAQLQGIGVFDPQIDDHRKLGMQVLLKLADISNVTKPFLISEKWAKLVTEEFFSQGDREKGLGKDVLPMFDREAQNFDLAKSQIGFINFVAKPFLETVVAHAFPGLRWLVESTTENLEKWKDYVQPESEKLLLTSPRYPTRPAKPSSPK